MRTILVLHFRGSVGEQRDGEEKREREGINEEACEEPIDWG